MAVETRPVNPTLATDANKPADKPTATGGAAVKSKNPIMRWLGAGVVKAPKAISLRKRTKFKSQDQHELGGVYANIATITFNPFGADMLPVNCTVRRESWLPSNAKWDGKEFDKIEREDKARPVEERQMRHEYKLTIPGVQAQRGDDEGAGILDAARVEIFTLYRDARKGGKVALETTSGRTALTLDDSE